MVLIPNHIDCETDISFYDYKNKNITRATKSPHKTINANKGEKGAICRICRRSGSENDKAGQKHKGAIVPPLYAAMQNYLCRWENSETGIICTIR